MGSSTLFSILSIQFIPNLVTVSPARVLDLVVYLDSSKLLNLGKVFIRLLN